MHYIQYNDIKRFYGDTFNVMMRHEAQNLVPLGNVIIGNEGKDKTGWRDPANWFMATISDGTGIKLTAIMTPPHNLTLYATNNEINDEAINRLVDGLLMNGIIINGVMTESDLALRFAKAYTISKGIKYKVNKNQRIYELCEVNPDIPSIGNLRSARESDMAFLPYWSEGFNNDCFGSNPAVSSDAGHYRYDISTGNLYILEFNNTPVSMAKINRKMMTVCGVGYVYTPPYFRGRGYATSCVAEISRLILERGFTKCVLYTDLANPTSNSIYQKIGYDPICDSMEIKFE